MISIDKLTPIVAKALSEDPELFSFDELSDGDTSYPELLEDIYSVFDRRLQSHGIYDSSLVFHLVFELMQYGGGVQLYIPKPDSIINNVAKKLIVKEFDGRNFAVLARRYQCSTNHIRRVINAAK
ncbi:Mor transcription activator family protein [Vibrio parahaemolyticus]|jgi:Mor family transcriptional regulator|uniref:Mor transcription activator family protein n=1 Tax=Vibrio harveyi group TaxID=717610 RepID=UPI00094346F2|nr:MULTISPECIES: Mor transcription activator family protein [Vibrio harveyi group]HDM8216586.1 transcriptional regulator [Vibrio campbellii]EJG1819090.1 transcriptional regulator [Vibrio parahaemolyticus]MCQ9076911.1 transcriptional regulator [Vibrio parahaemolyticus]MDF4336232.1 Mor transcription activator family protein [Vibrio parahaemolyticus]NOJ19058.1 transcriptional regulator [Vibrio jasicida]